MATNPIHRKDEAGKPKLPEERGSRVSPGVSPEHRAILEAALAERRTPPLNEVLASMPNVGLDSDFERNRD